MAQDRLTWIDAAKAISILLVTVMHCTMLIEPLGIDAPLVNALNWIVAPVRMPLFFAVAGVFSGSVIARGWSDLFQRRILLLIWLLLVWTVLRFLFFSFVLPNPQNPSEGKQAIEIAQTFIEPRTGIWFLWSLALFYIVTKLLRDFNPAIGALLAISASLLAMGNFSAGIPQITYIYDSLAYGNSLRYFAFFYIACCFPQLIMLLGKVRILPWLVTSAVLFLVMYKLRGEMAPYFPAGTYQLMMSVIGVAAMLLSARALVIFPLVDRALEYIGRNTLPIYVAQVPVIAALAYVVADLGAGQLGIFKNAVPLKLALIVMLFTIGIRMIALKLGAGWLYQLPTSKRAMAYLAGHRYIGAFFDKRRDR